MTVAMIGTFFACTFLVCFVIVLADMPFQMENMHGAYENTIGKEMVTSKNEETELNDDGKEILSEVTIFRVNGQKSDYLKNLDEEPMKPFPLDTPFFHRNRKSHPKECSILVQKVEMQRGKCTKLADNTPACHNDMYLAINYNEC